MSDPSFQAQGSAKVGTLTLSVRHVSPLWSIYRFPVKFLPFLSVCGELGSYAFLVHLKFFKQVLFCHFGSVCSHASPSGFQALL